VKFIAIMVFGILIGSAAIGFFHAIIRRQ